MEPYLRLTAVSVMKEWSLLEETLDFMFVKNEEA
jgi:hypothetical protein